MGFLDIMLVVFGNKNPTSPGNPAVHPETLPQRKVLIVEDEKLLADALELKFTHENFNVLRAENGQIGLDMATANNPDIILLDLMMPVMDGKTMLHMLR